MTVFAEDNFGGTVRSRPGRTCGGAALSLRRVRAGRRLAIARGFTLAELLVVIAIIAILLAIAAVAYTKASAAAQRRTARQRLETVAGMIRAYYDERREYPQMRLEDIDSNWQNDVNLAPYSEFKNVEQSAEALVYCLKYGAIPFST